jgi:hypothetical protein
MTKKTDNCRCVCVKKRKTKKEKKPKPQKQKALVDNYNKQIPIINMESRQTSFKGPLPAKKYSVFKPQTLQVEKVKSSKILTPLMKPPVPISRIESTRLKREAAERRLQQTIMEIGTPTRPSVTVPTTPTSRTPVPPTLGRVPTSRQEQDINVGRQEAEGARVGAGSAFAEASFGAGAGAGVRGRLDFNK